MMEGERRRQPGGPASAWLKLKGLVSFGTRVGIQIELVEEQQVPRIAGTTKRAAP